MKALNLGILLKKNDIRFHLKKGKKVKKEICKEASYVYNEARNVIIYNDAKVRYE